MNNWWSQIKTAGSAIYANRHFLEMYRRTKLEPLAKQGIKDDTDDNELVCNIIGDVFIHPSASIHPTATVRGKLTDFVQIFHMFQLFQLGPNVSIGPGVTIGPGVRMRESIVLDNAIIKDHTLVLHSISK